MALPHYLGGDKLTYEDGANDARSVQENATSERPPEMIWLSPEEALEALQNTTDEEMRAYYRGYLSRWD